MKSDVHIFLGFLHMHKQAYALADTYVCTINIYITHTHGTHMPHKHTNPILRHVEMIEIS